MQVDVNSPEQGVSIQIIGVFKGHEVDGHMSVDFPFEECFANRLDQTTHIEVSQHILWHHLAGTHIRVVQHFVVAACESYVSIRLDFECKARVADDGTVRRGLNDTAHPHEFTDLVFETVVLGGHTELNAFRHHFDYHFVQFVNLSIRVFNPFLSEFIHYFDAVGVEVGCASPSEFIVYFEYPPVDVDVGCDQASESGEELDFVVYVECTGRDRNFGNVEYAFAARLGAIQD